MMLVMSKLLDTEQLIVVVFCLQRWGYLCPGWFMQFIEASIPRFGMHSVSIRESDNSSDNASSQRAFVSQNQEQNLDI